jgi:hypothetical protein
MKIVHVYFYPFQVRVPTREDGSCLFFVSEMDQNKCINALFLSVYLNLDNKSKPVFPPYFLVPTLEFLLLFLDKHC